MTGVTTDETRTKEKRATARKGASARSRSFFRLYGLAILITLAGIGLWELIIRLGHVPEYLIPAPSEIAADMKSDWPVLEPALLVTLEEILLGFLISVAAGVGLAVLLHLSPTLRRAFYPILIGSQTVPIVVNGVDGLRSVDEDLIRMMRTLHGTRWGIFKRVEFPAALPSFFSGMRIAATFAAIGAVFGEWSGSSAGLGYVMLAATPNLLTTRIFAAIVFLTVVALMLFGVVSLLERILVPWAPKGGSTQ